MTSQLCRAATCAGFAASAFVTVSQAQSTTVVLPPRTELRRTLPAAGTPIVQQSPNGLYKLNITDTGIELLGPQGSVRITEAGVEIGANTRVTIRASGAMDIRAGATTSLTGSQVTLGCNNGTGRPAARSGDVVNTNGSTEFIGQGSPTVFVC